MAGLQQSLTVKVDASSARGAATDVNSLETRLQALEQAYIRTTAAGKAHGEAARSAGSEAEKAAGVFGTFGRAVQDVADHSRTTAIALEAMGFEAGAAAAKMAGLAEVMERARDAAPELLAIGGILAALSVSFLTLKESIDDAARSERELVTIGAMIRAGGAEGWKEQAAEIGDYAEALSRASTFAKTDFLDGMKGMLAAGVSVNDMLRSQQAAMDLAAARNISVAEAERELADAYNGRMRGLVALGVVTREEQQSGLAYETVLQRIEERLGGTSAAALDTFSGKLEHNRNLLENVRDAIGTGLLPVVERMADDFGAGLEALQPLADEFTAWTSQHLPELQKGMDGFGEAIKKIADQALPAMLHATEDVLLALAKLGDWFGANAGPIGDFFKTTLGVVAILALRAVIGAVWGLVGAFVGLGTGVTIATAGLNIALAAIITAVAYVATHWQQTWSAAGDVFRGFKAGVLEAVAAIQESLSGMLGRLADVAGKIPIIGSQLSQNLRTMQQQLAQASLSNYGAAHALENGGGHNTSEADFRDRDSGYTLGYGPQKPAPKTSPSTHAIEGTSRGGHGQGFDAGPPIDVKRDRIDPFAQAQRQLKEILDAIVGSEEKYSEAVRMATSSDEQQNAQLALKGKQSQDAAREIEVLNGRIGDGVTMQGRLQDQLQQEDAKRRQLAASYNTAKDAQEGDKNRTHAQTDELKSLKRQYDDAEAAYQRTNHYIQENSQQLDANRERVRQLTPHVQDLNAAYAELSRKINDAIQANREEEATHAMSLADKVRYFQTLRDGAQTISEYVKWNERLAQAEHQVRDADVDLQRALAKKDQQYQDELATMGQSLAQQYAYYSQRLAALKKSDADYYSEYEQLYGKLQGLQKQWLDSAEQKTAQFLDDIVVQHKSLRDILKSVYDDILKAFIQMISRMIVESQLFKNIFGNLGGGGMGGSGSGGGSVFSGLASLLSGGQGGGSSATGGIVGAGGAGDPIDVNVASTGGAKVGSDGVMSSNIAKVGGNVIMGAGIGAMIAGMDGGNSTWGSVGGAIGGAFGGPLGAVVGGAIGSMLGHKDNPAQMPDKYSPGFQQAMADATGAGMNGTPTWAGYTADSQIYEQLGGKSEIKYLADYIASGGAGLSDAFKAEFANATGGAIYEKNGMVNLENGTDKYGPDLVKDIQAAMDQAKAGGANGPIPTFSISRSYPDYNAAHMSAAGSVPGTGANTVNPPVTVNITVQGPVVGSGGINELATTVSQTIYQQQRGIAPAGGRVTRFNRTGGGF